MVKNNNRPILFTIFLERKYFVKKYIEKYGPIHIILRYSFTQ